MVHSHSTLLSTSTRRELGHRLGALRDSVLGQFTGEDESHRCLDLAGGDGRLLRVRRELGSLLSNPLEDVVHERVQNGHGLIGDSSIRVNLLQNLVDVRGVRLLARLLALLLLTVGRSRRRLGRSFLGHTRLGGLGGSLSSGGSGLLLSGGALGRHCEEIIWLKKG